MVILLYLFAAYAFYRDFDYAFEGQYPHTLGLDTTCTIPSLTLIDHLIGLNACEQPTEDSSYKTCGGKFADRVKLHIDYGHHHIAPLLTITTNVTVIVTAISITHCLTHFLTSLHPPSGVINPLIWNSPHTIPSTDGTVFAFLYYFIINLVVSAIVSGIIIGSSSHMRPGVCGGVV